MGKIDKINDETSLGNLQTRPSLGCWFEQFLQWDWRFGVVFCGGWASPKPKRIKKDGRFFSCEFCTLRITGNPAFWRGLEFFFAVVWDLLLPPVTWDPGWFLGQKIGSSHIVIHEATKPCEKIARYEFFRIFKSSSWVYRERRGIFFFSRPSNSTVRFPTIFLPMSCGCKFLGCC